MNERKNTQKRNSGFVVTVAMVACGGLFLVMFFLSLTVWQASGSFRLVGFLMREDSRTSADMFEAVSLSKNEGRELRSQLEEMFVRYYVEMRETILPAGTELKRRWGVGGPVHMLSSPRVYNKFKPSEEDMARIQESHQQRTVDILSVRKMKEGLYDVMFDVYQTTSGRMQRRRKTMSLKYTYSPSYRRLGRSFSNPFGMVFTDVNITDVKQ